MNKNQKTKIGVAQISKEMPGRQKPARFVSARFVAKPAIIRQSNSEGEITEKEYEA